MLNPDGPNDTLAARLVVGFALLVVVFILLCAGCSSSVKTAAGEPRYKFEQLAESGFAGILYRVTNTETGISWTYLRTGNGLVLIPGDF